MIGSGLRNAVDKAFGRNAYSKDVLRDSLVPLNIFDTADIEIDLVYAQPSPQLKRQREEMFPDLEEQEQEETRVPALASALRNAA